MPTGEAWQAFAGVGVVIIFLGGIVFALRRIGGILRPPAPPAPPPDPDADIRKRVGRVERDLADLRTMLPRDYVSRCDWTPAMSRILGLLEQQSGLLTRLDERVKREG